MEQAGARYEILAVEPAIDYAAEVSLDDFVYRVIQGVMFTYHVTEFAAWHAFETAYEARLPSLRAEAEANIRALVAKRFAQMEAKAA